MTLRAFAKHSDPRRGGKTRRHLMLIPFALVAWLGLAADARACGCVMIVGASQPCGAYGSAGVVFAGTVTEVGPMTPVEGSDGKVFTMSGRVTRFGVLEAFRGVSGDTVETFEHGTSCDYGFRQGERYFVYGARDPKDGKIYVSACSGTKTLEHAASDLAFARGAARGEPTPGLVGVVRRETRERAGAYRSSQPLDAVEVSVEGAGRSLTARTDAAGQFRVFGLPPGKYSVRAKTPRSLRHLYGPEALEAQVLEGRCTVVSFTVTSLSTINGRVVDHSGAPLKTKVDLVPLDEEGGEVRPAEGSIEVYTDDAGRYKFDWVAPGRYRVAVNPKSQPASYEPPYARTYLPGVREGERATVITVADGQSYEAEDFRLPPPLVARELEGVVVWPDGTPAPHALLRLEFTERDWAESTNGADEHGRFRLKVYEGFKYILSAEVRAEVDGKWTAKHSDEVEVTAGESNEPVRLVVNRPGFHTPRYVKRQLEKQQKR